MNYIKEFYNAVPFPGHYTFNDLEYHNPLIRNSYLKIIDKAINSKNVKSVIDIGCGTGLIANLFANRYKHIKFVGIDFSNSIYYAKDFSKKHNINNVSYAQQDLLDVDTDVQYDLVVCQGVLHHIPEYKLAINKINKLVHANGTIVLGVYNPYGKIIKKFATVDYGNNILHLDQEKNPYEHCFTSTEVQENFYNFKIKTSYPKIFINTFSLFNYKNGGLVT